MPKPSATTEACSRVLESERLSTRYGCARIRPKRSPPRRANGGEINPDAARSMPAKKTTFETIQRFAPKLRESDDTLLCACAGRGRVALGGLIAFLRAQDEHGTARFFDDLSGDRAKGDAAPARLSVGGDHDHVRMVALGDPDNFHPHVVGIAKLGANRKI